MTNKQMLAEATRLIEEVWSVLVPDRPPKTVAEDIYFDFINGIATRILSDIDQMYDFVSDTKL